MSEVDTNDAVVLQGDPDLDALISACADGKQKALEQLYKATSPYIFAVLRRILRTEALAEEALQETYFKIWNNATQYNGSRSAPKTWLVSIARNHAIDVLRRRKSREDNEMNLDSSTMDVMPARTTSIELQTENVQVLELCLDRLAKPAKECIVSAYCEGFSAEELSERLGRPIGTIKSWIRRSLIALKECIDGHS